MLLFHRVCYIRCCVHSIVFYCLLTIHNCFFFLSIKLLGAALPSYGKRPLGKAGGGMVLPGTKRTKSCYDRDVDPLYCAWGVDVYELFVNTKSDIGPNPYKADDSARSEYLGLPEDEKQKLGFEHRLFLKLQELVQHCDRTVHRNHEKLKRELQKQSQKRGGNDYVIDVSEEKVEELVRAEIQLEAMNHDVQEALKTLAEVQSKEEQVLEEQRKDLKKKEEEKEKQQSSDSADVKKEENKDNDKDDSGDAAATGIVIDRTGEPDSKDDDDDKTAANAVIEELGKLTLQKQELLCKIATIITQIGPLEESIHVMTLKLNFVRSDTTTDKTVCEVSGNFMSARDADERIAAHYAGKQYVGWKLVRDKFQQMIQKYGRNGPPRPRGDYGRGGGGDRGGPLQSHQKYMQQGGGGDRYGGGGYNRGRDDRGGRSRYGGGGGGGGDGGRWERGGGGYGDRDRGRYDRYDDRRRGGGGGYGDRGGGGGYDRRGGYGRR